MINISTLLCLPQVCVDAQREECEPVTVTRCFDVEEEKCENVCTDVYWCKVCNVP